MLSTDYRYIVSGRIPGRDYPAFKSLKDANAYAKKLWFGLSPVDKKKHIVLVQKVVADELCTTAFHKSVGWCITEDEEAIYKVSSDEWELDAFLPDDFPFDLFCADDINWYCTPLYRGNLCGFSSLDFDHRLCGHLWSVDREDLCPFLWIDPFDEGDDI